MLSTAILVLAMLPTADTVTRYKCVRPTGERVFTGNCAAVGGKQVPYEVDAAVAAAEDQRTKRVLEAAEKSKADRAASQQSVDVVKSYCADQWPTDFRMQQYCFNQQVEAVAELAPLYKLYGSSEGSKEWIALAKCSSDWEKPAFKTYDYRMVLYCFRRQKEAIDAMGR